VNYKASTTIHAKHDKTLLSKVSDSKEQTIEVKKDDTIRTKAPSTLLSNVCCQDMEPIVNTTPSTTSGNIRTAPNSLIESDNLTMQRKAVMSTFVPPPPPKGHLSLSVAILTVSDRAASNEYKTGDLSGPKVEESILSLIETMNQNRIDDTDNNDSTSPILISCNIVSKSIVPDETESIQQHILTWSGKGVIGEGGENTYGDVGEDKTVSLCDLIFTTGGTGFSPRDVTPEATLSILDRECRGLMSFCSAECSAFQPLATLSRGCAGVCGQSIVVNLPGNPSAIGQIIDILFPLLMHAVKDMKGS